MLERRWRYNIRLELHSQLEGTKRKPADPTVVLVNGLFADLSSFDGACFYLREKYQILRYDCRGQGKSPKPDSIYHLDDHVNDLYDLLNQHEFADIVLVGLSNGGRIALEFARRYPQIVRACVACDTYDVPTPMIKAKLGSWLSAYKQGGGEHRFDIATPWIWGEEVFNEKSELLLSYRNRAGDIPGHVVHGLILGAMETAIDVTEIECPILYVAGREDVLTPVFIHEKMKEKSKDAELKVAPGGHASLIERPGIMESHIIPWLETIL